MLYVAAHFDVHLLKMLAKLGFAVGNGGSGELGQFIEVFLAPSFS